MRYVYVVYEVEGNPYDRTVEQYPLMAFDNSIKCMVYIDSLRESNPDKEYDFEQIQYFEDKEQKNNG